MPYKSKKPCCHPGCPNLTDGRYCEAHNGEYQRNVTDGNRHYDRNVRDKVKYGFYHSTAWTALAKAQLKHVPYCEECYRNGRMNKADIADHIESVDDSPHRRLDSENLQSLCRACHNRKHGQR